MLNANHLCVLIVHQIMNFDTFVVSLVIAINPNSSFKLDEEILHSDMIILFQYTNCSTRLFVMLA